jgi:hypothetical protein
MKHKIITSLACLLFLFFASAQETWLPAKQVVEKFHTLYDVNSLTYHMVEFEKRKGDWYVKIVDFADGEIVRLRPELFYSSRQKEFLPLKIDRNRGGQDNDPSSKSLPEGEEYNFDIQPYYGYPGWYKDVIKEYGSRPSLSDTELYALGRAYSSSGISPVTDQGSDVVKEDQYKMPFKRDAFSDSQLQQFRSFADSGIEKFRQLSVRNPKFQTRVGDIRDKYANEVMFKFHTLLTFSEKGFNQIVLPKNLYKDSTLKIARAWLRACPQQSIFVSFGDNDFYPLLYVQQSEGFRKDVYIINYNLLGVDRFIYRLGYSQLDAKPIKLSVDTSLYMHRNNEIIFLKGKPEPVSSADLLDFIRHEKEDEEGRKIFAGSYLELPWKKEGKISKKVKLTLPGTYLLRHQWVLLDMISNLDGRVLCFAFTLNDELVGLNQYLTSEKNLFMYNY